ncbi:MAG: TlpA family protein disulfide reductase, partial [Phycisphaerales bacterium]|nr:TlpA family protein disulfide reductase [Phycisphaerales bacterium]
ALPICDDAPADWKVNDKSKTTAGSATVDIGEKDRPFPVSISLYRFDKGARPNMASTLLYYRDYAYEGAVTLGGKEYKALLSDEAARGDFRGVKQTKPDRNGELSDALGVNLLIDANGNGKFDSRGESFDIGKPFNIGGTTYEVADMARDGSAFKIVKSSKTVAEIPTPPDHSVGKAITAFETKDTEGKPVKFPDDYKGKVVLLDFWATWCAPCMAEMPNVVKAYGKYHDKGFEVLGISLDNEQSLKKMPDVMQKTGMTWRQVADGKYWQAEIAQKYAINSIPATFLVDGTTGKILGANLRGEALDKAVEKALNKDSASK